MFLLDTDIATLANLQHVRVVSRLAAEDPAGVAIPIPTRLEILRGRVEAVLKAATAVELVRAAVRFDDSERFLAEFTIIGIDEPVAAHFDRLRSNKKLKKIGRGDLLNACIALAHDATLVTRNTKDFAPVPGLKLDNWTA